MSSAVHGQDPAIEICNGDSLSGYWPSQLTGTLSGPKPVSLKLHSRTLDRADWQAGADAHAGRQAVVRNWSDGLRR